MIHPRPRASARTAAALLSMVVALAAASAAAGLGAWAHSAARQPSPDDTIRDLERGRTPAPAATPAPTTPTTAPAPVAPAAEQQTARLLREGTFLSSRRGRLTRSVAGELLFTFDADARGRADPAMVMLPSQNLQAMERVIERAGETVTFTVSGQVYVYKGRNFLMPTLYQVNRRTGEVNPAQ
jgi:hypothetical protein